MSKPRRRLRLIAYIRVSKVADRSGDSFQSPDQQRDAIGHAVALRPGAEVIHEIVELDESGGTMNRPGLREALDMIERGLADGIVVAKLDRFARDAAAINTIEDLERHGHVFISAADNFDTTTAVGRFALGMMVLVARLERDRHVETWDTSARNAISRGVHTVVPYGYRRANGKGSPLIEHPDEAPIVRRIFDERDREFGVSAIADGLNADGIPAPRGGRWTRQTVRAIIKVRSYTGEARYGSHVLTEAHPRLVADDVWERAQPEATADTRGWRGQTLLAGLVRCAGCGYVMGCSNTGKWGRRYNCGRHHATGACPAPTTGPAERLEALVEAAFLERYGDKKFIGAGNDDPAVGGAREARDRAQRELIAWRDDVEMREVLGDEDYRAGLLVRKRALDDATTTHELALRNANASTLHVDEHLWHDMDIPDRRFLLRKGIDAVVLRRASSTAHPLPERVDILWTGEAPDDLIRPRRRGSRANGNP